MSTRTPTTPVVTYRQLADIDTAASHLNVCTRTLRNLVARGELNAYRIGTKALRFDMAEVDALAKPVRTMGRSIGAVTA